MKFSTKYGKLIHIMKYKIDNDSLYSANNYKLVAYCGVVCGENNSFTWADTNENPELECPKCTKIKNTIIRIENK